MTKFVIAFGPGHCYQPYPHSQLQEGAYVRRENDDDKEEKNHKISNKNYELIEKEEDIDKWLNGISKDNYSEIVGVATQPEHIRGFGHIKIESIKKSSLFKGLL